MWKDNEDAKAAKAAVANAKANAKAKMAKASKEVSGAGLLPIGNVFTAQSFTSVKSYLITDADERKNNIYILIIVFVMIKTLMSVTLF